MPTTELFGRKPYTVIAQLCSSIRLGSVCSEWCCLETPRLRGSRLDGWPKMIFQECFLIEAFELVDAETVRHSLGHDKIMGLLAVMSELPRLSKPDSNADKLELR